MLIDCDTCAVRDLQCGECVMSVLLLAEPGVYEVDEGEACALATLADSGLVPRLRLIPLELPRVSHETRPTSVVQVGPDSLDSAVAHPA